MAIQKFIEFLNISINTIGVYLISLKLNIPINFYYKSEIYNFG